MLLTSLAAVPVSDLAAAERVEHAVVHHVAGVEHLGGQELLDLRAEATAMLKSRIPQVRRAGCLALKHFGTIDQVPALTRVLRDKVDHVAAQAAVALGSISDQRSIGPLVAAFMRDGAETKEACILAISTIHERRNAHGKTVAALERMYRWSIRSNHFNDQGEIRKVLDSIEGRP